MSAGDWEECRCGRGWFDPSEYNTCYACCLERQESYVACIFWVGGIRRSTTPATGVAPAPPEHDRAGRDLRLDILIRDDFACRDCGSRQQPEIDHIKPCLEGGKATPWNLQVLCHDCNQVKRTDVGVRLRLGCDPRGADASVFHFGWPMLMTNNVKPWSPTRMPTATSSRGTPLLRGAQAGAAGCMAGRGRLLLPHRARGGGRRSPRLRLSYLNDQGPPPDVGGGPQPSLHF